MTTCCKHPKESHRFVVVEYEIKMVCIECSMVAKPQVEGSTYMVYTIERCASD